MTTPQTIVENAQRVADEVLWPAVMDTDAATVLPTGNLDALAAAGFYGLPAPESVGGLGADFTTTCEVIEIFAGADLTTAFVWSQHLGALLAVIGCDADRLREKYLAPLCRGEQRAGLILTGVIPGPARVQARATSDRPGWIWNGTAPWLSGWERISVIHAAARDADGNAVWALLDAEESESLHIEHINLVALNASNTVTVRFVDHFVPASRVTGIVSEADWSRLNVFGVRIHGALTLGIVRRAAALIGPGPLDRQLEATRHELDMALTAPERMPEARARAAVLAHRAAATCFVAGGAASTETHNHAARLVREAAVMLVFGSRAPIKAATLAALAEPAPPSR